MAFRLAVALAVAAVAAGAAVGSPTAIVDRTWSCPLHTSDGFRVVGIAGSPGFVDIARSDAGLFVSDELAPSAQSFLLSAGSNGVTVDRRCTSARRVALTRKGLPGPPGIFQANYDCESKPRSVLVRFRAAASSSGPWRRRPPAHLQLLTPISRAELSVQTPSGRPIAYVTIAGKQVRLWISPDCVRD